jgi:TetR/AcrR family transcriptional regulator, cholesterol catabolism regulator
VSAEPAEEVPPRPTPRQDVILARAAELFAACGYRATSLAELAEAAGIAKPTIFHHFRSKQDILYALYAHTMDIALTRMQAAPRPGEDPARTLHRMIREHALLILDNRDLFKILFDEESELAPQQLQVIKEIQARYIKLVAVQLERLRGERRLRPGSAQIAVQGVIGMASWVYRWYEPERERTPEEIAEILADLALGGLVGPAPDNHEEESTTWQTS